MPSYRNNYVIVIVIVSIIIVVVVFARTRVLIDTTSRARVRFDAAAMDSVSSATTAASSTQKISFGALSSDAQQYTGGDGL